jgi:hypothetical protein
MPDEMETISEAIARLRAAGYEGDWRARSGQLVCDLCGTAHDPQHVTIEETVRFEGDSNPDDEAVLFALSASCGHRGLYAAPYGPDVSPDDVTVIRALHAR